jgi:hypothetical protein
MARLNWDRIGLHVIFWMVYVVLNAALNNIDGKLEYMSEALLAELFSMPPKITLVYFIFYYIIPLYLDRSKVGILVLLMLVAFTVTTVFYRLFVGYVYYHNFDPDRGFIMGSLQTS